MSTTSEKDLGFPWFEDHNFSGWLIQFKAHLKKSWKDHVPQRNLTKMATQFQ
jgi:hypothetical protein